MASTPPSAAPIRGVVFDFGGVLITPITRLIEEVAGWHGVAMVEMLDVLMGPRELSTPDHPWHRAERGEMSTDDLQEAVVPWAAAAGISLRGDEYARLMSGDYLVNDSMIDRVIRLAGEGYRTALLTNSFKEFREVIESHIDFSVFDAVIDSSEVGCRKPEPEIYEVTTRMIGLDPGEILYLDDFEANLVGARAAGWRTIHVTDADVALADLDATLAAAPAR